MTQLFDDLFKPLPWYQESWYALHRLVSRIRMIPKRIKWFVQRGRRGWADCDIWSLDWYLAGWLPDALRHLKATKNGIPMEVFPTEPQFIQEDGNPAPEAYEIANENWNYALDKMIAAFEAWTRIGNHDYPVSNEGGWNIETQMRLLEQDEKIFQEGATLFIKHFGSLWD